MGKAGTTSPKTNMQTIKRIAGGKVDSGKKK